MNIRFNTFDVKHMRKKYFTYFEIHVTSTGWIGLIIFNRQFNIHIWKASKEG